VTYRNGSRITARYSGPEELSEVIAPHGTFRRSEDGHWELQQPGQPPRQAEDVRLDEQGRLSYRLDGESFTVGTDGSTTRRAANGDVVSVTRSDGTTASFEYGQGGRLTAVHEADGTWTRSGYHWEFRATGQPRPTSRADSIELDENNNIVYRQGQDARVVRTDGTERTDYGDRSAVSYGADASVTSVRRSDGTEAAFRYNPPGHLTRIDESSGGSFRRARDGHWDYYEPGHDRPSQRLQDVRIDNGGNITVQTNAQERYLVRRDGTAGSEADLSGGVERDAEGRVTSLTLTDHSRVTLGYDSSGHLNAVSGPDGSWSLNNGRWEFRQPGHSEPSRTADSLELDSNNSLIIREGNDRTIVRRDRTSTTQYGDGSMVTRNAAGEVTNIRLTNGRASNFRYDDNGDLAEIDSPNGSFRQRDGHWELKVPGQPPRAVDSVEVDEHNNIVYEMGGDTYTLRTDGSTTRQTADGDVAILTRGDGSTADFEYDSSGQLTAVHESDGTWRRVDENRWDFYPAGQTRATDSVNSVELDESNSIVYHRDGDTRTVRSNGTERIESEDHSAVEYNADGYVTNVTRTGGDTTTFGYDSDGQLNRVTNQDGSYWRRTSDGRWEHYQREGEEPSARAASVEVREDGSVVVARERRLIGPEATEDGDDRNRTIHRDGSETVEQRDRLAVTRNAAGDVTGLRMSNGSTIQLRYGDNSQLTEVQAARGTFVRREGEWELRVPGQTPQHVDSLELSEDNELVYWIGGDTYTVGHDGSTRVENASGDVTSVTRGDGSTVHFEYDRPGHLTAVREEDGTWSRAGDRWEFRERGRQAASETVDSVRIDANNSIVYRNGQETRTVRTDGSERIAREDRSVVNYRPDGHVSSITRTDGGRVTLDYDSTGHPTAVREGDGTWRRAGDHWEFYPIGHRRPTERVDSVSVDEDGSIIYRVNGHHRDIVRPDGSETRQYDDGRVRNRSANGEVAETHGGAGTGSERHPDRQPTGAPPAAANNAAARRLAEAQREAGFQPDAGARVSSDAAGQAIAGDAGRGRSSQTDGQTSTRPGADQPGQAPRPADAAYGSVQRIEAGSLSPDRAAELRWREDITEQRQHLDQAIERIADPAARAEMRRNMEEFEMRAQRRLMDASQVRDTYRQISRLLEQPSQAGLSEAQRTQLAREVLGQAAHPTTVDQGQHGTCTVASAESRIYTSDPAAASRLVADVALTGRYRSTDGRTTVTINPETLQPDRESQRMAPGGEEAGQSDRSYASQIFQVTAVNLGHARREYTVIDEQGHTLRTIPAGQVRYEPLREPQAGAVPPDSTGERLLDYSRTPPNPPTEIPDMHGRPARSTGLSNDQVVDLNNAITGRTDAVLIEGPGAVGRQTVHVNSAEELRQRLVEYQGHYPVQIAVHSGNEPFAHDSGGGAAGGSGGWHMITITGYDQQTGRVMIDNQWGEATDHLTPGSGISVHDLYLATIPAGDRQIINTLERDVAWNREHITIDTFKELELLRQRRLAGQLSDRQYDDAVAQAMTDAAQRWNRQRANGTFDQAEHDRAITHFQEMASSVGPYRQLDMLRRVHDAGALTDEQYRTEVVVTMTLVRLREQDDRAHGTFDQAQHDRIMPRFDEIRSSMSSEDQLDMARRLRATGYYTDQQYDDAIVSTMVSAAGRWHQQRASGTLDAAERQHTMDRAEEMMTAIRDTDQEHGQERMQSIRDRIVQQVREQRAAEQATAHPAPDAGHQPAQGGGADAGASDHAAPQVPAGGDAAARRVADAQRQATFAPTDGGLEETIRQAAGPASGSDRTVESLLAETGTTGGDRGHHSDLAGRREESESHRGRREAASEAVAPEAVRERLTEHTGTPVARYHGEMIRRDVEPATHTMRADETVEDIARAHLQGTGATEEEIAAHAREINEVNGGFVMEGQELILPGHTSDGGFVTRGAEGSRQTAWADGVVRINNADGTGWVRRFSTDGGMSEHHWGPNPGDNFDLTRTPDGRYRIAEAGRDAEDVAHPETDARVQRAHLEELLDSRAEGPNDRTARIRDDMREFERRAREQHLSDEEIARTYAEVSRMLEHEGDRPLTAAQRLNVAEQVLHQAAHPQTIDQGNHSTCGAASTESRIYTRHPSDAARLVAEVATTGHFTTRGEPQRTVTIDPRNLTPGPEEQVNPPRDGQRSQAGQIFESTFVTLALDSRTTPPGHIRYEQREPHSPPPDDTGEWIVDSTTTPPTETRFDGMLSSDLTRTEELISGRHEAPYVLDRTGDGPGTVRFNSEEELRARLAEAQARGHMPVVIAVDSMNEPFRTDSGGGSAGGSGAGHFVTVTSYDAEHNMVSIDNQWGDEHDHTVHTVGGRTVDRRLSTHDLFAATAPHDLAEREAAADAAHRQLDQDRERGVYDGRREVAALLMDRIALRVTPEEFDRRLVQLARESRQRWARTGESHPGERRETEDAYRQVVARIREQDPARAEALERSLAAAEA
jgi:YD repeat-containing protein